MTEKEIWKYFVWAWKHGDKKAIAHILLYQLARLLALTGLIVLSCLALSSCGTTRKTVSSTHTETIASEVHDSLVLRDSVVISWETHYSDSVVIRDSVVVRLDCDGNTLSSDRWHSVDRNREKGMASVREKNAAQETSRSAKNDKQLSDRQTVYVEKTVAIPWWKNLLMWIGGLCLACSATFVMLMVRQKK